MACRAISKRLDSCCACLPSNATRLYSISKLSYLTCTQMKWNCHYIKAISFFLSSTTLPGNIYTGTKSVTSLPSLVLRICEAPAEFHVPLIGVHRISSKSGYVLSRNYLGPETKMVLHMS